MKKGLRLSQLEDKPEHRLRAMSRKYYSKMNRVSLIVENADVFNVPLNPITRNVVKEKKEFYRTEIMKIWDVHNWKYNDRYTGMSRWIERELKKDGRI